MPVFLADIIGSGITPEDAFRPAVADYGGEWNCHIDLRADPTLAAGKMVVRCADNPAFAADARIVPISSALLTPNGAPDDGEIDEDALAAKLMRRGWLRQMLGGHDFPSLDTLIGDLPAGAISFAKNRLAGRVDLTQVKTSQTVGFALSQIILPQIKVQLYPGQNPVGGTFTDNFTDTDGVDLAAHTPSGGTAWTRTAGSLNDITILTNTAKANAATAYTDCYLCDNQGSPHQYTQYVLQTLTAVSFVCNRMTDDLNFVGNRVTSGGVAQLYKRVGGTFTSLATGGALAGGETVKQTSNSSDAHEIFVNGVSTVGPVTDAFNNTVTRQGLCANSTAVSWIDNFEAGVLAVGFTAIRRRTLGQKVGTRAA